jgi:dynein heavy chain
VSKVFQGISKTEPRAMVNDDSMIKLWAHECLRVFHDRLVSQEDRDKFKEMLKEQMTESFKKSYDKIVEVKPLLFASYVPTLYPEGDDTKKQFTDIYCELTDREKMRKVCQDGLEDFNTMNRNKAMDLVLFGDAMEHCCKIHRVITTEFGHALLVGVGGSGRNSLTELATFIANFTIVKLDIPKGYTFEMWRDDLKANLYLALAYDMQNMIFFFSDT